MIELPVIEQLLIRQLDLFPHIILLSLFSLFLPLRQYKPCKTCNIIGINVVFGFFEEEEYRLPSDLKVLARLLNKRQGLAVGVEGAEAVELLIEGVDYGVIEVVHVCKGLCCELWVGFL